MRRRSMGHRSWWPGTKKYSCSFWWMYASAASTGSVDFHKELYLMAMKNVNYKSIQLTVWVRPIDQAWSMLLWCDERRFLFYTLCADWAPGTLTWSHTQRSHQQDPIFFVRWLIPPSWPRSVLWATSWTPLKRPLKFRSSRVLNPALSPPSHSLWRKRDGLSLFGVSKVCV